MKKVLSIMAIAAVMLFVGKANAQITIHAGYQNLKMSVSNKTVTATNNDGANGFYAGVDYNIALMGDDFGVAPGAIFSYFSDMMDIRIPIMCNWRKNIDDFQVGVFAGPTIGIGLAGDMYDDPWKTKRFDIGINGGFWVGWNQIRAELGYSYGLLDRFGGSGDNTWTFNKVYIGLGYSL